MIKFKVITPSKGALERQVMEAIKTGYRRKLTGVFCPEHHQQPTVIVAGSINALDIQLEVCCEKLKEAATKALGGS